MAKTSAPWIVFCVLLALFSTSAGHPVSRNWHRLLAVADTDSVAVRLDSLPINTPIVAPPLTLPTDTDSVAGLGVVQLLLPTGSIVTIPRFIVPADMDSATLALPDTGRVKRYLPRLRADDWAVRLIPRRHRALFPKMGAFWRHEVKLDSADNKYTIREYVGRGTDVRYPLTIDAERYQQVRLQDDLDETFRQLVGQRSRRRQQRRRGFGINVVVPGGRKSAFTTIFGKPELDLRVNGQVNIQTGFNYQKSDQQTAISGRGGRVDPDFEQNIRLGITGSIGDKLRIDVNWDTERTFDYQNQLKLEYSGYEDDIVQKVIAGNVFLQTPASLIQGGQSLFGIRTDWQLGGLRLTTVMSQQESEGEELVLTGGSQTNEFEIRPTDYEDDIHFFLSYYFRNHWETAHSAPPVYQIGIDRITDIEVWKLQQSITEQDNERQVIAITDLAENRAFIEDPFLDPGDNNQPPDPTLDRYTDTDLDILRDGTRNDFDTFLENQKGLIVSGFQKGKFKRLEQGRDYDFDPILGYLSIQTRLTDNEALAVAYRYIGVDGQVHQVGDFANESGGATGQLNDNRLVLKLLRRGNQIPSDPTWTLMMKNIYQLPGGRSANPTDFELDIFYERPGQPASKSLPGVVTQQTLLQILGLDRLNADQAQRPDNKFDFYEFTVNQQRGLLVFPTLQPFAGTIAGLTDNEQLIYTNLYIQKKVEARRDSQHDVYRIKGSSKSGTQSVYNLGFFGVVEGSISVTSGGTTLVEGTDYIVDYSTGSVQITNPAYISTGRDVKVTWDRQKIAAIQKKTLVGVRADYDFSENITLGSTLMRLSERPVVDKYRIGDEPVSNVIWGVDGDFDIEPRWLTRAVDALPFIQTKAPSKIQIKGEFAQLLPGHPNTRAFDRTLQRLQRNDRNFKEDELGGITYIDEFESFENAIALTQPGFWNLSSAPDSIGGALGEVGPNALDGDSVRTTWRGALGWYILSLEQLQDFSRLSSPENLGAVRRIDVLEVFPNKDVRAESAASRTQRTFDVFFDPTKQGPYNFGTSNLDCFDEDQKPACRKQVWAGMMQRIPEGYTDFDLNNVEFVEFIFSPHAHGLIDEDAKLVVDLGSISEDVLPNNNLNTEDGLALNNIDRTTFDEWGRLATSIQEGVVDVDDQTKRTEDLGLDGLPSSTQYADYEVTEQSYFSTYLEAVGNHFGTDSRTYRRILADPSKDDYHHFRDDTYFGDPNLFSDEDRSRPQVRETHFFAGSELNSFEAQNKIVQSQSNAGGNAKIPDSEDINLNNTVDLDNRYYQYFIPLDTDLLDRLAQPGEINDFVVRKIQNEGVGASTWYVIRIPVRDPNRRVGGISDFNQIRTMRLWMTGLADPMTLRFAAMELVGSQWQKSSVVGSNANINDVLSISAVNNEESQSYQIPNGAVIAQTRNAQTGGLQNSREQAMVLRVKDMIAGDERAIFKTFTQRLDLLKYSVLRMFSHAHGGDGAIDGTGAGFEQTGDLKLFIRLGLNEDNDYYEYEQPLVPSTPNTGSADSLWQTNIQVGNQFVDLNSIVVNLTEFNLLKLARDDSVAAGKLNPTEVFTQVRKDPRNSIFPNHPVRLRIKGNPSLSGVTNIVIGVRADSSNVQTISDAEVWLNELRVTGYDEENGWAAIASAQIKLADLATVSGNIRNQTDGFGSLSSGLGTRETNTVSNWAFSTSLNLHKLIPERYGWNIPLSYSIRSNRNTPRYSPDRGDIRLTELLTQVDENPDLDAAEKQQRRNEVLESAETASQTTSISLPISKRGSSSAILRNTLDAISFNYSASTSEASNPSSAFNDSWRWSSSLSYRLTTRKPRTVRPFWFLDDVPVLGVIGRLRMSYVPQSVSASASAQRAFAENQERSRFGTVSTDSLKFQERLRFPIRETHAFSHDRKLGFQYNPFSFLNLGYDSSVNQSLRELGIDTLFSVTALTPEGQFRTFENTRLRDLNAGQIDSTMAFEVTRLEVKPFGKVFGRFINGSDLVRTDKYNQRFTASFQPQWRQLRALSWITIQPISYSGQFNWQNGPAGQPNIGAGISNNASIRGGLRLALQEFWRKFDFYKALEKQQKQAIDKKRIDRARKKQEKARREQAEKRARDEAKRKAKQEETEAKVETEKVEIEGNEKAGQPIEETDKTDPEQPVPAIQDTAQSKGFPVPLPSLKGLMRNIFLALTSSRDLSVTYSNSWSGNSSNISGGKFNLLDAFGGNAPSLSYRLGLSRQPDSTMRFLDNPGLTVSDALRQNYQFGAKTNISITPTFRIDLNWDLRADTREDISYRDEITTTQSGSNQVSIWAFGGSYDEFFKLQLDRYNRDVAASEGVGEIVAETDEDHTVLSNEALVEDFRAAFTRSGSTVDELGFIPLPLPNWSINYTGLGGWPILRAVTQSVTLRHSYSATYDSDYRTNVSAGTDPLTGEPLTNVRTLRTNAGPVNIRYVIPQLEIGAVRINERFQPLLGLNISWKGGIQTDFNWNKSQTFTLSTTNADVNSGRTEDFSLRTSFSKRGLRLPFLKRKKLNNTIRFTFTFSLSENVERRFRLQPDLEEELQELPQESETFKDPKPISTKRLNFEPRVSYTFSNRVSADFFVKFEQTDSSRLAKTTNVNGGFNFRINITN